MTATATVDIDTAAIRALAKEFGSLAENSGDGSLTPLIGPMLAGPGAQAYVSTYFHVSGDAAGWNILFADISTFVAGRAADFGAYLRQLNTALSQSAAALTSSADLYESVNEDQRAALDGLVASGFDARAHRSRSLPAQGYQPTCARAPMSRMTSAPAWDGPSGPTSLIETILTIDYFSPSGLMRQGMIEIFDIDPLAFITQHFAGDWSQVGKAAEVAGSLAWFFGSVADNIAEVSAGCAELWTGPAADAAFEYFGRLTKAVRSIGEWADEVERRLRAVSDAMFDGADRIAGLFTTAADCVGAAIITTGLGASSAATVVGPALASFIDALLLAKAFQAAKTAFKATQALVTNTKWAVAQLNGAALAGESLGPVSTIPLPGGA